MTQHTTSPLEEVGSMPVDECKGVWRVIAPDGMEWRSRRLLGAVLDAIEQTQPQFLKTPQEPEEPA